MNEVKQKGQGVMEEVLKIALNRIAETDDALGKIAGELVGTDDEAAREAIIAIATAHLMSAKTLLLLCGPPELAAKVFSQHVDRLHKEQGMQEMSACTQLGE